MVVIVILHGDHLLEATGFVSLVIFIAILLE
jgi:hypothetical protein